MLYSWDQAAIVAVPKAPAGANGSVQPALSVLRSWLQSVLPAPPRFLVADVAVNSVYAAGWGVLGDLAAAYGDAPLAEQLHARGLAAEAAVLSRCWDVGAGHYSSLYKDVNWATRRA